MEILDMHAHILPGVDDGSQNLEESVKLLEMLKEQGVNHVVATPHFFATQDNIEDFNARIYSAYKELTEEIKYRSLPEIYLGSEVLYFLGLGSLEGVRDLTFNNSRYMLIEFAGHPFDEAVCRDIRRIRDNWAITPIIAHIERYKKFSGYSKLLKLVKEGVCKAQVNASSVVGNVFSKTAHKLLKNGMVHYIGSDTHSVEQRPPKLREAYSVITAKYGKWLSNELIMNSEKLLDSIK